MSNYTLFIISYERTKSNMVKLVLYFTLILMNSLNKQDVSNDTHFVISYEKTKSNKVRVVLHFTLSLMISLN